MMYCFLGIAELGREMIGEYFNYPSGASVTWTLDADGSNIRSRNKEARLSRWAMRSGGTFVVNRSTTAEGATVA